MGALGERREGSKAALGPSSSPLSACLIPAPTSKPLCFTLEIHWDDFAAWNPEIPKWAPFGAPGMPQLWCLPWEIQVISTAAGERDKLQEPPGGDPTSVVLTLLKGSLGWRKASQGIKNEAKYIKKINLRKLIPHHPFTGVSQNSVHNFGFLH